MRSSFQLVWQVRFEPSPALHFGVGLGRGAPLALTVFYVEALRVLEGSDRFGRVDVGATGLAEWDGMRWFQLLMLATLVVGARGEALDFSVESPADGKVLKSAELRGRFVALHFLLKTECPFCLKHTHDYASKAGTLPNVVQVFLKPDSAEEIKAWAGKLKLAPGFPALTVYRDAEAALAKRLKIPDGYQFHGQSVHYPALVLLNEKGEEVFRYVGKGNTDRFSFERLAEKVRELEGK